MRRAQAESFKASLEGTGLTIILLYDGHVGYTLEVKENERALQSIHTVTAAKELLRKRKPGRTHANRDKAEARP